MNFVITFQDPIIIENPQIRKLPSSGKNNTKRRRCNNCEKSRKGCDKKDQCSGCLHLGIACTYPDIKISKLSVTKNGRPEKRQRSFLTEQGMNNSYKNLDGCTPLHIFAQEKNTNAVKTLMKNFDVDVNAKDINDQTPLHLAAENGDLKTAMIFVEQLHADINARNKSGLTPLHVASKKGHRKLELFLNKNVQEFGKAVKKIKKIVVPHKIHFDKEDYRLSIFGSGYSRKQIFSNLGGQIEQYLRHIPLLEISFQRLEFGEESVRFLMDVAPDVKSLSFWGCAIPNNILEHILQFYFKNSLLRELSLTTNSIGDHEASFLAEYLKLNKTLTHLNLSWNQISNYGASALAECLKLNKTLTHLGLICNQIGNGGASALAKCLNFNNTLTHLDLHWNRISNDGTSALAECLKLNNTLTHLDLRNNQIGNDGTSTLAECLKLNNTLTHLDLGGNQIGNDGASALAECLKFNSILTHLNLNWNYIGGSFISALTRLPKLNKSLHIDVFNQR